MKQWLDLVNNVALVGGCREWIKLDVSLPEEIVYSWLVRSSAKNHLLSFCLAAHGGRGFAHKTPRH